ncbi:MAG TPA: hypothetical protein VIJ65_00210 [Acidobacteriaceae bacterium]
MYAKVGALSPAAFSLSLLGMVALADNDHSKVYKGSLSSTNNRIPCRLYRFADDYYVICTRPACPAPLGAKLIAVDALLVDEVSIACAAVRRSAATAVATYVQWVYL